MSVHDRKRLPPHRHFQTEIDEVNERRPLRPAYKGVHWSDMFIADGSLTLDETLVRYIRQFEADLLTLASGTDVVNDSTATNGQCIRRTSAAASGTMWRMNPTGGPVSIGAGEFYAVFMMRVASNASSSNVIQIGVAWADVLQVSRILKPSDFVESGKWQKFAVKFRAEEDISTYEFGGWNFVTGITDVSCDWVGILPANVPLGDTDIDTNPHAGTTAASSYMPNTLVLNLSAGSEVNITTSGDVIRSGTCDSLADAINLALIRVALERGSSGGAAYVKITVRNYGFTFYNEFLVRLDADITTWDYRMIVPMNLASDTIYVLGKAVADSVYIKGAITVQQFKTHTHTMTDPDNHTVTNPSHEH